MLTRRWTAICSLLLLAARPVPVCAAVTEDMFQVRDTSDLVGLCSAGQADPLYVAAIHFCQGFGSGAYGVASEYEAARSRARMFCPPGADRRPLPVRPVPMPRRRSREGEPPMKRLGMALVAAGGLALSGCADLTNTQQRAVTGTGIGAAGGAVLGAIGGNAGLGALAGAGAGLAGGLIFDNVKKSEAQSYRSGYAAGYRAPR